MPKNARILPIQAFLSLEQGNTQRNKMGLKSAFSKGKRNEILEKWCRDNGYNLHDISMNYDNCIHCPKNTGTTKEVLITNY